MGPTYVNGAVPVDSVAGVASCDLALGNTFFLELTENITSLRMVNSTGKDGQPVFFIFHQDSVARTVTPDGTTLKYRGGATAIPQGAGEGGYTTASGVVYGTSVQIVGTVVGA
jgi:hypothetical protein